MKHLYCGLLLTPDSDGDSISEVVGIFSSLQIAQQAMARRVFSPITGSIDWDEPEDKGDGQIVYYVADLEHGELFDYEGLPVHQAYVIACRLDAETPVSLWDDFYANSD